MSITIPNHFILHTSCHPVVVMSSCQRLQVEHACYSVAASWNLVYCITACLVINVLEQLAGI
jgi:hypothetical protein